MYVILFHLSLRCIVNISDALLCYPSSLFANMRVMFC